jgi:hypothetical protein
VCAGGTRRRRRRGHRYATGLHSSPSPRRSVIRHGAGWREAGTELSSGGSESALRHTRLDVSLLWLNDTLLNVGIALWVIRAVSNVSRGIVGFLFALNCVVWLLFRYASAEVRKPWAASAGCFSSQASRWRSPPVFASAKAASPTAGDRGADCWRDNANDRRDVHSRRPSSIRRRAGASASTCAIPDAARHGPRAATNGGSCARHRCRRPWRAGWLARVRRRLPRTGRSSQPRGAQSR